MDMKYEIELLQRNSQPVRRRANFGLVILAKRIIVFFNVDEYVG